MAIDNIIENATLKRKLADLPQPIRDVVYKELCKKCPKANNCNKNCVALFIIVESDPVAVRCPRCNGKALSLGGNDEKEIIFCFNERLIFGW